ncbi:peptide ABC transporter permease [Acrocarpospora pleiomorpha]|uniref:Peptide ABC transporter permease n=1 Tax=Acrocarpospora pleiomorpha TaxID=90975 RepID=A0A5M3XCV1_9ACTN|nr:dipeptide/oligopeptide/nickel ABC transporter permease/ATP-binding protein [Acrocarpospora pleiomorpha]GES17341.1 peptide ABC transporter permease [Acrocarpospora pleiomorpha]
MRPRPTSFPRRFLQQRLAALALVYLLLLVLAGVFAPALTWYSPDTVDIAARFAPWSWDRPLGADATGRDIYTRLVYGTRLTLGISLAAVTIGLLIGTAFGVLSGLLRQWVDTGIQRVTDVLLCLSATIFGMLLAAAFGPSWTNVVIAAGLSLIPVFSRLSRSLTFSVRNELYIEVARAQGASTGRIVRSHLLPNIGGSLIAMTSLSMGYAILSIAGLGFLGIGGSILDAEWGSMMGAARNAFFAHPGQITVPGLVIIVTVVAFMLLSDGLQAALDPRLGTSNASLLAPTRRGVKRSLSASREQGGDAVLNVERLTVSFDGREAVRDISFSLRPGETLGIVGESGSGKSATASALLGLLPSPPARVAAAKAQLDGIDLMRASEREIRDLRGGRLAYIAQNPMKALNPLMTIGAQIGEALTLHQSGLSRGEVRSQVIQALAGVGISDPARRCDEYPHQMSGGMLQRVAIAMAMINRPDLLIADEPTTALDVTVQAQVLDLLNVAKRATGAATVLITHDIGVVSEYADRVCVLYSGEVVETGPARRVVENPRHPYTRALLASSPRLDGPLGGLRPIPGRQPGPGDTLSGCRFAPRCAEVLESAGCMTQAPTLRLVDGLQVRCHRAETLGAADSVNEGSERMQEGDHIEAAR